MGRDKWSLPFGEETLLQRTVRLVRQVVDEVWVVAREGQRVDVDAPVVHDPAEGLGPLAGLVAGLEAIEAERAFLTSCDVPFLRPEYIRLLLELSAGCAACLPQVEGFHMTTSAVYAKAALPAARRLLAARRLRPLFLFQELEAAPDTQTRLAGENELRRADPDLVSFRNCNTPEEYAQALREAGIGD